MPFSLTNISENSPGGTARGIINGNNTLIVNEMNTKATNSDLTTHTGNATIHRQINDSSASTTTLYSSSKINTLLTGKANSTHNHSASQITDGGTTFALKSHTHPISEITGIAGLFEDLSTREIEATLSNIDESFSKVLFSFDLVDAIGRLDPPLRDSFLTITWSGNGQTQVDTYKIGSEWSKSLSKPAQNWTGWGSTGLASASIEITIKNTANATYASDTFIFSNIERYNYSSITVEEFKQSFKDDTDLMNDFKTSIASMLE